jgi:hypothetical protein
MKRIIIQCFRGMGYLPHLGEHPGTIAMIILIIMGFFTGIGRGNILFGVVGALIMIICLGPFYLYGAYDRAQLSDKIEKKEYK